MKVVLILTVGTTADPILKAIEEARQESPADRVTVVLLYGRPLEGQKVPTPFDVAYAAKQKAHELGVDVRLMEMDDPEDIDRALEVCRQALQGQAADADRVIVNFTGGTKVMSAAVVHAALTEPLSGELILDYTGGEVRDEYGKVIREAMRVKRTAQTATAEFLRQVKEHLRGSRYRDAYALSRRLPDSGRAGFVRRAVETLYLWDEFNYEEAVHVIQRSAEQARALTDDEHWGWLAQTIRRLLEPGQQMKGFLQKVLRPAQQGGDIPAPEAIRPMAFFIADALENCGRRIQEGRLTDSVLRAYRAVEMAVQGRLLRAGVNPWKPQWSALGENVFQAYLTQLRAMQPPRELALTTGLRLLEAMGQVHLDEASQEHLWDVQRTRNHSYLEHGFDRVESDTAEQIRQYAIELCECIWGEPLEETRARVRHA